MALFFINDGIKWIRQISGTNNWLRRIWGVDNNNIFAIGDYGTIVYYDGINGQCICYWMRPG